MNEEIKELLAPHLKEDTDVNSLVQQLDDLLLNNSDKDGGIYCVHIKSINGKTIRFKYHDSEDDDFAVIKFGTTENYKRRFSNFGFTYDVIFKIPGSEKFCKSVLCGEKFHRVFFKTAGVPTIKKKFGLKHNPAPTEWRIVSSALVHTLKSTKMSMTTYQAVLKSFTTVWEIDEKELTIEVGNYSVSNKKSFEVATVHDEIEDEIEDEFEDEIDDDLGSDSA